MLKKILRMKLVVHTSNIFLILIEFYKISLNRDFNLYNFVGWYKFYSIIKMLKTH